MCRFALYLGEEIPLSSLLTEPVNSIIHQSFDSHERAEPLNGDGFGIAWYAEGIDEPALFKAITPAWNNLNLRHIARVTRTRCLLAHVRAATPGLPVQRLNCHPFSHGPLSLMHNGKLGGFPRLRRRLLEGLSDEAFSAIRGSTDSEHVFALLIDRLAAMGASGNRLEASRNALRATIAQVEELRREAGAEEPSTLNLALCDGRRAVVSRFVSEGGGSPNSLYVHAGGRYICEDGACRMVTTGHPGAVIIASEPLSDDPGWDPVPANHVVSVSESLEVRIDAL